VHCTLSDWATYAVFHLAEDGLVPATGLRLLQPETMKMLHSMSDGYAAGWAIAERSWAGGVMLAHSGSNTMNFCSIYLAPARKFGILIATNCADGMEKIVDELAGSIIKHCSTTAEGK
jgi:hypothetical protein